MHAWMLCPCHQTAPVMRPAPLFLPSRGHQRARCAVITASGVCCCPPQVYLNLVLEYVPDTVYRINKHYTKNEQRMPIILVKLYTYQMLRALAHIHSIGVCHRRVRAAALTQLAGDALPGRAVQVTQGGRRAEGRLHPPQPAPSPATPLLTHRPAGTSSPKTCWSTSTPTP